MKLIILTIIISIILEASITTLPLVLLSILFLAVIFRTSDVYLIAFISGVFLDLLTLGRFGFSSLYFTAFVFLIYTYQRKFEIETIYFMLLFAFFGSFIYLLIQGGTSIILQSLVSTGIITASFIAFKKFNKKASKYA